MTDVRLLLVSDLHYTLRQYDWVDSVAAEFDVVVVAGDHIDIASAVPANAQVVAIIKHLRRVHERTTLLVSSGNHDLTSRDEAGEKVAPWMAQLRRLGIACDGAGLEVQDSLLTVCPWWDGPRARQAVGDLLARDAERGAKRWIWIYHAPPDGSPTSWAGQRHYGDADLLAWLEQYRPAMVLCGHIHQSPFRNGGSWVDHVGASWVFNAGRQIGPVPAHIIVDTEAQTAHWHSLAGTQRIDLASPTAQPVELSQ